MPSAPARAGCFCSTTLLSARSASASHVSPGADLDQQPADALRARSLVRGADPARRQRKWQVVADAARGAGRRARGRRVEQPRSRRANSGSANTRSRNTCCVSSTNWGSRAASNWFSMPCPMARTARRSGCPTAPERKEPCAEDTMAHAARRGRLLIDHIRARMRAADGR